MLQVWLPLHKNLNNNGLTVTTITNSGATINAGAYQFDGTDDYISIGGITNLFRGGTVPFTVSFWFYHTGNSRRGVIFGNYGLVSSNRFNIEITASNYLRFWWDSSPDWTISAFTIPTQTWIHCTIVYNGTDIKIYKDGVLNSTRSGALTAKTPTGVYYLGRDSRTGATAFYGKLSDFRIYDHALSTKEIVELSKGLLLHYTFDDYSIEHNTLLDKSGMGNDAIIGGSFVIEANSGARYEHCTRFNSNYLLLDDVLTSENKQFTISVWLKPTKNQTGCIWNGRSSVGRSFGVFYIGGGIRLDDNGGQMQCSTKLPLNQWTHVVCIWEAGGQKKIYYNGVLQKSGTAGANSHTNTKATIGMSSKGDSKPSGNIFIGYMSDYRIYRKALSATETLNLYQDGVIIDNKQNTFVYEFIEGSNGDTKITKNGNFKVKNTITENTDAKIFKNGNIETKQIYEY